jgi:spore coat protein U-like protein
MKKVSLFALLASMVLAMSSSFAASPISDNVSVTVNLTSACTMTTPTAINVTYTSFGPQVASTASEGTFNVKCTNTLPYKVGFTNATTPAVTKPVAASANNNQLTYQLSLASGSGTGNGSDQANRVIATVDPTQSGTCATGSCTGTAETHTVYVAY